MKALFKYLFVVLFCAAAAGCETTIEMELPPHEKQLVVEGRIEEGDFPLLIITRSQGFYEPINAGTFSNFFVNDAEASVVVDNTDTVALDRLCSSDLPDSLRDELAELLNVGVSGMPLEICIYLALDERLRGKAGSTYRLMVKADGKYLEATTTIQEAPPLDTLYFKADKGLDSLGFLYARFHEPPGLGDAYRWFAQRINHYTYGSNAGEQKDANFIPPVGSVFDDEFVDGQEIDFVYQRGRIYGSLKSDDNNEEWGYFKRGDTVVVKFTAIDRAVYKYYRSYYASVSNSGSPFATPANVVSNVKGGLGIWAGYGISLDTVVAQ